MKVLHLLKKSKSVQASNNNSNTVITNDNISRGYKTHPSLAYYLPWKDYNDKLKVFLLEDNKSLATAFNITPIACEARPQQMMEEISKSLSQALKNAIPCEKNNPWILQVFVERNSNLSEHFNNIKNTILRGKDETPLIKEHLKTLKTHFDYVSRKEGIFFDRTVTNQIFRGGFLNIRAVLYRRVHDGEDNTTRKSQLKEITKTSRKLSAQLRACGLKVKRINGNQFYQWMACWFNPHTRRIKGNLSALVHQANFPADDQKPFNWDLTEQIFFNSPISFNEGWIFDGLPHKVITIQSLSTNPEIGHLSAERKRTVDDKVFNLIDHLPEGSVLSMNIVMQAQSEVELHLKKIEDSAVGRHALAMSVKNEIATAAKEITDGNYLLPIVMALFIRGENFDDLSEKQSQCEVLLNSNGFKVITDDEVFPIDTYLRYLPMCYDFHFDKHNTYRSRYVLLSDIAKLLPFYGRSRGTENPGFIAFNRGGEPWYYDIYKDKTKNAHFLLLGETGTGKSNLLNFLLMQHLALYNPRLFIIEAGGSFDLFASYCQSLGLKVNKIKIDPKNPISLNPFAQGLKVLEQIDALNDKNKTSFIEDCVDKQIKEHEDNSKVISDDDIDIESRDILGEMVIAALVMITGGEEREEKRIRRSDRMLVMDAIIEAALNVKAQGGTQLIASDIVDGFDIVINKLDTQQNREKIKRAREMADGLKYFTKDPLSSKFFNAPGEPWELSDITLIDMGKFAHEGYEAQRSVAFAGCVSKILELAEANQYSNRAIYCVLDENHLFTKIPLLADLETLIAKTGRKFGLWLWLATQNCKDFADSSRKMLSLIETWMCLALPPDEIDQIERFKPLTTEQRSLFLSARKEKGKYTEGVLLSPKLQGLFRNIPPRLYLAMAATDQDEKNQRKTLMKKLNISELEAVSIIADQMMQKNNEEGEDD